MIEKKILRKELLDLNKPTQLMELERRLNIIITDHDKAINDLKSTDRKSLLDEIEAMQAKLTDYEEKEKDEISRELSHLRRQCINKFPSTFHNNFFFLTFFSFCLSFSSFK